MKGLNIHELVQMIDHYAETRHICGDYSYNIKCQEARDAVITALVEVLENVQD